MVLPLELFISLVNCFIRSLEIVEDFSKFCTGVCKWSGMMPLSDTWAGAFNDTIIVEGQDDDAVKFWPKIEVERGPKDLRGRS